MMTETTIQVTEPLPSPANTLTCNECRQEKPLFKDGVCLGCYGLTIIKKVAWDGGGPVWFMCGKCGKEWSKLKDNNLCYDCDQESFDKLLLEKINQSRLIRIFGSIKTANHFTFGNFRVNDDNKEAFDFCKDFKSSENNLYLWGPCGTGKTHLAYSVAKVYFLHGRRVVITTPMRMVDTFRTKSELEKEDRMQEYTECDLLLVDDFGISKYTDFAIEVLCELLNRRTLQMKNGLIVTSNLSLDQLSQKNRDDRVTSRLAGLCKVLNLHGADFRTRRTGRDFASQ